MSTTTGRRGTIGAVTTPGERPRLLRRLVPVAAVAVVVLALVAAGVVLAGARDLAAVDDCVARADDTLLVVDCDADLGQVPRFRVLAVVEDVLSTRAAEACSTVAGASAAYVDGPVGAPSTVLCLGPG